jgi:hypothetical protein
LALALAARSARYALFALNRAFSSTQYAAPHPAGPDPGVKAEQILRRGAHVAGVMAF